MEVAQEGQDEAMSQAPVASSAREASGASGARNVKLRVGASQEDSTGVSSRMEDVLLSRKKGSEEMRPSDDPNLTPADESMGICEMVVILLSLGMAPANFKMAESFCRNRFGEAAVSLGFEHGLVLDCATGWNMSNEEQMKEVGQRVCDEEPVLLIGSPMCRAFSTLRGQSQEPRKTMRHTPQVLLQDV